MKRAVLLLLGTLLAAGVAIEPARGQTAPSAPTISSVSAAASTLTVVWTAPSDTGTEPISSYDLRYILSDASDKSDDKWIEETGVGSLTLLQHTISGLRDSTGYDVQVRAVSAVDAGAWSDSSTQTTSDHGNTKEAATLVTLDSVVEGRIHDEDDFDMFRIDIAQDLTDPVEVWIYTEGQLDTRGNLFTDSGTLQTNDDSKYPFSWNQFAIRKQITPGTTEEPVYFYLTVEGYKSLIGPYTLFIREVTDPGDSIATATVITADVPQTGRLTSRDDPNWFKFELTSAADVWVTTYSPGVDTRCDIMQVDTNNPEGVSVAYNDDSNLPPLDRRESCSIRKELEAGTYYIRVRSHAYDPSGKYVLFFQELAEANGQATARLVHPNSFAAGRVDTDNPHDYLKISSERDLWLDIRAFAGSSNAVTADVLDGDGEEVTSLVLPGPSGTVWGHIPFDMLVFVPAGTHYVRVGVGTNGSGGTYILWPTISSTEQGLHDYCGAIESPISDQYAGCQWHLDNAEDFGVDQDINALEAWETTKGEGVNVAIVDTGLHYEHGDLKPNVLTERNHAYFGTDVFATDNLQRNSHGTKVAGLIAARDDERGMRGVAPRASIYLYNMIKQAFESSHEVDALTRDLDTSVSNNSYGFIDSGDPWHPGSAWELAIETGITDGFDGKGTVYVFAAGNGGELGDNSNLDGRSNYHGVVAACAVNEYDSRSYFSEVGANLWVCAPVGSWETRTATTDTGSYTLTFNGTSAATPIVAGVAALVRAANPDLTWRDVKLILAGSARKNDPGNSGWIGGARQYGSDTERYHFNHEYGFGVVDAGAAVELATGWTNVPRFRELTVISKDKNKSFGDRAKFQSQVNIEDDAIEFVEFVELNFDIDRHRFRDLQFELVSPSGKTSQLQPRPPSGVSGRTMNGSFRFGSALHLGENPVGKWTLKLHDRQGRYTTLRSWSLTIYGHGNSVGQAAITSTVAAANSITVNWDEPTDSDVPEITGYDLRYIRSDATDRSSSNWTTIQDIWSSGTLSYELSGLGAGVGYDLQVRATTAQRNGSWSEEYVGSTTAVAPSAPAIVGVTPGNAMLTVAWQTPTTGSFGITSYDLRYIKTSEDETDDANWTVEASAWSSGGGDLQYLVGGLDNDVDYDVQVRATNSKGTSSWSATSVARPRLANVAPEFPASETGTRTVLESASMGTNVGAPVAATDGDGDDLTYGMNGGGVFSFDPSTGQLRTAAVLDYEGTPSYSIMVTVSDLKDANGEADTVIDDTITLTVNVEDVNEAPTLNGQTSIAYSEYATAGVGFYSASDPDGDPITWMLEGADAGDFDIDNSGVLTFKETPDHESPADSNRDNEYLVTVKATDDGGLSGRLNVTVNVTNVDEPPTLEGADSVDFREGQTGQVARYTATDPEGVTIGWSLAGTDAGIFRMSASGVVSFRETPDHESPADANRDNDYRFTAVASDGGLDDRLPVKVTVVNVEEAGTITVVPQQPRVGTPLTATLTDPDGELSDQTWEWEISSNRSTWTEIDGEVTAGYTPITADVGKHLRVSVSYGDGHGTGKRASLRLGDPVQPQTAENQAPAFSGGGNLARRVTENTDAGQPIGEPIAAVDPDRDPLTYSLDATGATLFDIDEFTGQLRTKEPLDYEQRSGYTVTVAATDPSGRSGTTTVVITVADINEAPEFPGDGSLTRRVAENTGAGQPIGEPIAAVDPDGDRLTYSLDATDDTLFDINVGTGQLLTEVALDYEQQSSYTVTVTATDSSGSIDRATVTINIGNANEPVMLSSGPLAPTVLEQTNTFVADYEATDPDIGVSHGWSVAGSDGGDFQISGDGALHFRAPPDFEAPTDSNRDNVYRVDVVVFDGAHTDTSAVNVTVENADEPGAFTVSSIQPQAGTDLTVISLTDPDGAVSGELWKWERSSDQSNWSPIPLEPRPTYQPTADDVGSYLRATVEYTDGHGSGKSATTDDTHFHHPVRAVPPDKNSGPTFLSTDGSVQRSVPGESLQRSVEENTDAGESIGQLIAAYDPNGDPLTYSLDAAGAKLFDIDRATGQLLTKAPLDHEQRSSYSIVVTATDPFLASGSVRVTITVEDVDEPPELTGETVVFYPQNQTGVVARYRARDPEGGKIMWNPSGSCADGHLFLIDGGALSFCSPPVFDTEGDNSYEIELVAKDPGGQPSEPLNVIVVVTESGTVGPHSVSGSGGGGGGGGGGPSPSTLDFEWTVKHDIEALDSTHDSPTGSWSDGATLWVLENGGADDAIYAYDLESGERVEEREFELDERNRAPRGVWSDGETMWVSDSGQNKLFAYDLESGERLPERDIALAERNRAARGIWSDGETMWVLDGRRDALFAYDLKSGELLAEYALDGANDDPRGIWSDGVTVWVSDHGAKRLFAYRLPELSEEPDADEEDEGDKELERVRDEEFPNTILSSASNNSPRGIWSDGDVMYVADASDGKVYSYNMPDAIDARLASLTLSGVEIGAFSARETEYTGVAAEGVAETTVEAAAVQSGAGVVIDPPDADEEANGDQVALEGVEQITVTVTSGDGSRTKVYVVRLAEAAWDPARDPWPHCLRGAVSEGFSLLVYEGGSVGDLVACAESREIAALYALHEGVYRSYIIGAPEWVNSKFSELFAGGFPVMAPLTVKSDGPPSADPFGDDLDGDVQRWPQCLRGTVVEGFSLVVYGGGSMEELVACAEDRHVTALYALRDGKFVPYILAAPEWVNRRFAELFPHGLPPITALVAQSDGPPEAN